MNTFINLVTTKRSGHHAFMEWLEQGAGRNTLLVNNAPVFGDFEARMRHAAEADGDRLVVVNFEGVSAPVVDRARAMQRCAGISARTVYFLRDPLNMLASSLARKRFKLAALPFLLRQACAHADAVRSAMATGSDDLFFYNHWVSSGTYRARIAERLGIADPGHLPARSELGRSSFASAGSVQPADPLSALDLANRWRTASDMSLLMALKAAPALRGAIEDHLFGRLRDSFGLEDRDAARSAFWSEVFGRNTRSDFAHDFLAAMQNEGASWRLKLEAGTGPAKKRAALALFAMTARRTLARRLGRDQPVAETEAVCGHRNVAG